MFRSLILAVVLLVSAPLVANAGEITLLPSVKLNIGDQDYRGNYWDGRDWRDRGYWHRNYEWRDRGWHRHHGWDRGRKSYEKGYREGWKDRDDHRGRGRGHGRGHGHKHHH